MVANGRAVAAKVATRGPEVVAMIGRNKIGRAAVLIGKVIEKILMVIAVSLGTEAVEEESLRRGKTSLRRMGLEAANMALAALVVTGLATCRMTSLHHTAGLPIRAATKVTIGLRGLEATEATVASLSKIRDVVAMKAATAVENRAIAQLWSPAFLV